MKFDLRYLQIIFLSSFLAYGIYFLAWDISIEKIGMIVAIALLTQGMFCLAFKIPVNAIKSSMITALGISIIMRSNFLFIYGIAGFFAVSSKYIFRVNNKHFFNPANFGVIFIILFTGVAWISPAQWGQSANLIFVVGSMALLILTNLRKIDLALSFILFFFGLDFLWNIVYKGWEIDFFLHNISSGSIVLFTFFMITDPSSTPNSRIARVIWVALIALIAFYLQTFLFIKGAPLYALFIMSFSVPVFDIMFRKEGKFSWDSIYQRELFTNDIQIIS
jgi:Na+-transporting NADH:ubiquinone oxidoreductase subunit NqrB